MIKNKNEYLKYLIITLMLSLALFFLMLGLTDKSLFGRNPYNSYALQANSWRLGRLDLGQDYPHLELAIYGGKYYCSFPLFPSYVLFPLTFIFESSTPDFFVMLFTDLLAVFALYTSASKLGLSGIQSAFFTVFATFGANTLFLMIDPGVWFMAQMMCFAFSALSITSALYGKGAVSLFLWGAAVGCRPMQVIYLPVILFILYKHEKNKAPDEKWYRIVLRKWYWGIPVAVLALSYMVLNYMRFGSILQFGHDYLPEFQRAPKGQFDVSYMKRNFESLMRLPQFDGNGKWIVDHFGNLNMFIASPISIVCVLAPIILLIKKKYKEAEKC